MVNINETLIKDELSQKDIFNDMDNALHNIKVAITKELLGLNNNAPKCEGDCATCTHRMCGK